MARVNHPPPRLTALKSSAGLGHSGTASEKVYHTVTACVRCRQRKTRCDSRLPRCDPCERSNAHCEYFDSSKNRTIPRAYISCLQSKIKGLQAELLAIEKEESHIPDAEAMVRTAGTIKFNKNDDYRYLGPSSGIAITRLVMELAKQNTTNKSIREIVSDTTAQEIKQKFDDESRKVYPQISSVAAPQLPTRELTDKLVDIYMAKAQYMLPLLHEPTFRQNVQAVCLGSGDATLNFQLRLVIAISMQKLDARYAGLADSYYLAALPYLESAVRKRDLSTLQCLALIAQYSVLTPTRTASYWVVGLAARLCQELGLCEERTIKEWPAGTILNTLEVDMRRRLFWIITSMEYGLAHSLGRPSAFGITVDHIDVGFFELCDDRFITPAGLVAGHRPVMKKCISAHFFRMRLLQAEIRRTLYLRKRERPVNDQDPWFINMQGKLDEWVATCPRNDEGSGLSEAWFCARQNTMIVLLYRPSPQVPVPSQQAAERCYDASVRNVNMQSVQIAERSVDLTWIFTQSLFMALNTILWSLSYPAIRRQHPIEEVRSHISMALVAIDHTSQRWPGVQSALQLYQNLVRGCLSAYADDASYVVRTPPAAHQETSLPPQGTSQSPASSLPASSAGYHSPRSHPEANGESSVDHQTRMPSLPDQNDYFADIQNGHGLQHQLGATQHIQQDTPYITHAYCQQSSTPSTLAHDKASLGFSVIENYNMPDFDPHSVNNEFPTTTPGFPQWSLGMGPDPSYSGFEVYRDVPMGTRPWLGSFGDEYSQYLQQAYYPSAEDMQILSEQQQLELMAALEHDGLPEITSLGSDTATSYAGYIF